MIALGELEAGDAAGVLSVGRKPASGWATSRPQGPVSSISPTGPSTAAGVVPAASS